MTSLSLTQEQKDLFDYIDSIIPASGHLRYDFRDPKQFEFANLLHELNGFDRDGHPGRYRLLEDIKAHQLEHGYEAAAVGDTDNEWVTTFEVVGVGSLVGPSALAAANGQGTVVNGCNSMNMIMYVQDNVTKSILASGHNESFGPVVLLPVETASGSAKPNTNATTAYLSYSFQPSSASATTNRVGDSGVVKKASYDGPVADPTVTQPKRTATAPPYNPNAINIGLARAWTDNNTNLDYWWNEPVVTNPIGKVPLVGNVTFNKQIATLTPGNNFNLTIQVSNAVTGGTATISPANMTPVYAGFSISPTNNKQLTWNLPAGTSSFPTGNPIVFTAIPWATDLLAYFVCYIQVTFTDGTPGFASIVSSNQPDDDPLDGTAYIMPIEFIWHCLAGGTQVLLKGGATKAIEELVAGDEVQVDKEGKTATVRATIRGFHSGGVLKIRTGGGHELVTTDRHVLFTPEGMVSAGELENGDEILVLGGTAKVTSVEILEDYTGLFHNLAFDNGAGQPSDEVGVFIANGIQVGDAYAQRNLTARRVADKEWLKQHLGDYWATDIESHFSKK